MDVVLLGECMLELSMTDSRSGESYRLGVGGDTFNTAAWLAHRQVRCHYLTGLGDDSMSETIRRRAASLGIGIAHVVTLAGRQPGLYAIHNDTHGERSFSYWREQSAARMVLQDRETLKRLLSGVSNPTAFFISGITLALCSDASRSLLFDWLQVYRRDGGVVIYDPNFRAKLWAHQEVAKEAHLRAFDLADVYLPGLNDLHALHGFSKDQAVAHLRQKDRLITVLKDGSNGAYLISPDALQHVPAVHDTKVVDTTGAGDAFNGIFVAGYLASRDLVMVCHEAAAVAARVVGYRGALREWWGPRTSSMEPAAVGDQSP